jgi:hypothetical protein
VKSNGKVEQPRENKGDTTVEQFRSPLSDSKHQASAYSTNSFRIRHLPATESSFEQIVRTLRLSPEQYAESPELRAWVRRNKSYRFVPPDLLAAFGFDAGIES